MPAPCKCRSVVKFSHSGRAGNARFLSKAAAAPAAQLTARGQHFKKQTRVVVDRNDVYDLKHYLEASNSVFECASGPSKLQLSFAELSVLFKPQPTAETQIAAFWASMSSVDRKDAAYGAILGAFVGDAAGGVLEFMDAVDAVHVDAALTMPGGGCWELGPGQVCVFPWLGLGQLLKQPGMLHWSLCLLLLTCTQPTSCCCTYTCIHRSQTTARWRCACCMGSRRQQHLGPCHWTPSHTCSSSAAGQPSL